MLALGFCVALFVYLTVVGCATVSLLHADRAPLRNLLVAPAIGIAVTVLPLFTVSRLGLPVMKFGAVLAAVLFVAAAGALAWLWKRDRERVAVPWPRLLAFAVVLVLALYMAARPMASFGFGWVSYCTDDMANFALAADRVFRHGFFDFPAHDHLLSGTYYPSDYYFTHVTGAARPGSELLLAAAMSVSGRNGHEVFMPVLVAFHLALLWAAAALVLRPQTPGDQIPKAGDQRETPLVDPDAAVGESAAVKRWPDEDGFVAALFACVVMTLSSLMNLAVFYQLVAQVSGLALLAAMAVLLLRSFRQVPFKTAARHGVLLGIGGAALLVVYPEVCPFLAVAFAAYLAVGLVRRRIAAAPLSIAVGVAAAAAVILLRASAITTIAYVRRQAAGAGAADTGGLGAENTLFPYFMIPKGWADFWGILPLAGWTTDPGLSIAIAAGGLLLLAALLASVWLAWRGNAGATVALVMFGVGAVLFRNRSGFGLFKLALYIQPFVLAAVVAACFELMRRRRMRADVVLGLGVLAAGAYLVVRGGWLGLEQATLGLRTHGLRLSEVSGYFLPLVIAFGAVVAVGVLRRRAPRMPWIVPAAVPVLLLGLVGLPAHRTYLRSSYGVGTQFLMVAAPSESRINYEFSNLVSAHPSRGIIISDTYNVALAKLQALYTRGRVLFFPATRFFNQVDDLTGLDDRVKVQHRALVDQIRLVSPHVAFDMHDPQRPGAVNLFWMSGVQALPPPEPWSDNGSGRAGQILFVQTTGRQNLFNRRRYPVHAGSNYVATPFEQVRDQLLFASSELGNPFFVPVDLGAPPAFYQIEKEPHFFPDTTMAATGRYILVQLVNPSPKVRLAMEFTASYQSDGENLLPTGMAVVGASRVPWPVTGRGSARLFSPPVEPQVIRGRSYLLIDIGTPGRRLPEPRIGLMKLFGADVAIDRRAKTGFARDISLVSDDEYRGMHPPSRLSSFTLDRWNPLRKVDLEYSGMFEDGKVSEQSRFRLTQPAGAVVLRVKGTVPDVTPGFRTHVQMLLDGQVVAEKDVATRQSPSGGAFEMQAPVEPGTGVREVALRFTGVQRLSPPDGRPVAAELDSIGFQPAPRAARR